MSTPILPFAVWASGTNQNSIPANDNSLRNQILNGLVISDSTTAQPALTSPADDGSIYIITGAATGAQWATFDEFDLAIFDSGTWYAFAPVEGVTVNLAGALVAWDGAAYVSVGGGGGTPGGSDTQVQFNDASAFGGDTGLVYNKTTDTLTAVNLTLTGLGLTAASATGIAGFRLPHGAAPTSPVNGDVWTTSAGGMYVRINGVTVGPLSAGGSFTGGSLTSALNEAKGTDIASASTTNIGAATGNLVHITGTTGITAFDTVQAGTRRILVFDAALVLSHNATSLILPAGANITTAAGDTATMLSEGSGNWRCVNYSRKDGTAVTTGGASITGFTASLETAAPNAAINISAMTASGGTTNQAAALVAKGNGPTVAQVADGTTAGGDPRGGLATDWQKSRNNTNQVASGSRATIGGGERNRASGGYTTVAGGYTNAATSDYSSIGGGELNTTSATHATVAGGFSGTASGIYSAVSGGTGNTASGQASAVTNGSSSVANALNARAGGANASTLGITGCDAWASGQFSAAGDAQSRNFVLRSDTTNATPEAMTTTNAAAGTTNQVILPNSSAFTVTGTITARESGGNARSWKVEAFLVRGANAAATTLVAGGTPAIIGTSGGFTGTIALTADTTNGGLAVTVTGVAATNIKWVAELTTAEVVG